MLASCCPLCAAPAGVHEHWVMPSDVPSTVFALGHPRVKPLSPKAWFLLKLEQQQQLFSVGASKMVLWQSGWYPACTVAWSSISAASIHSLLILFFPSPQPQRSHLDSKVLVLLFVCREHLPNTSILGKAEIPLTVSTWSLLHPACSISEILALHLAHHLTAAFPLLREVWGCAGANGARGSPVPRLPSVLGRPWSLSQGGGSIPLWGHYRAGAWGRPAFAFSQACLAVQRLLISLLLLTNL